MTRRRTAPSARKAPPTDRSGRGRRRRLVEYEAKRDFAVTPEPAPGGTPEHAGRPSFMIHKHDASRLHYDVRLEMDDALASWAVPKGPSYDPAARRFAVQTEDHPIEYGQFEGRIPDGEYGAGDSIIWDRGTYDTVPPGQASEQRKKGHLNVVFDGEKLKGRWHLVRTRGHGTKAEWLMFKAKDEHADPELDVVAERPESVVSGRVATRGPARAKVLRAVHPDPDKLLARVFPPMLATLVGEAPPDEPSWICELKYDGFRALCALSGGRVAMWSRNRLDLAPRFPAIVHALAKVVVGEAVIDGEAVALDEAGISRFQRLQQSGESILFAFDLLWLDGQDLRGRPIEERRDLLASLLSNAPAHLRVAERLPGTPTEALAYAKRHGYEGVLLKARGSTYEGRRSRCWLKLKAENQQELAIVGFTPSSGPPNQIGALLLGVMDRGRMVYAGKVGTGFSAKLRTELKRALSKDAAPAPTVGDAPRVKDATWVKPRLVAQVQFTEWTEDGKLRHPSFQGLREDKKPEECTREIPSEPPRKTPAKKTRAKAKTKAKKKAVTDEEGAPEIRLSHPEKVLFPKSGITKADVVAYYEALSGPLTAALAERPIAFEQWPQGIHRPGVFRQNLRATEVQPWMTVADTPTSGSSGRKVVSHLVVDKPETLRWLGQMNVLTFHMWSARMGHLTMPDWVVFDLDPAHGEGIAQTIEVAHGLKRLLDELGLPSLPKTSGKRGLHVFVPLKPGHTHEDAIAFAVRIGHAVTSVFKQATLERAKNKRHGRLYFDCYQNGYGKTVVSPYSLRPVEGGQVSAPLRWSEVEDGLDPAAFTMASMPKRLQKVGDLWADVIRHGARLPRLK